MQEELYIIKSGVRTKIDLNTPSGITLNYKSNMFGDISKISASFSYTFKLPMSLNNRIAFDSPEDVRHVAAVSWRKYKCEFRQNGIDLFSDANLYIESTNNSSYSAVMTWGIVSGFEALKDGDVSLRELGNGVEEMGRYGSLWCPTPQEFSNDTLLLHPYRGMGIYDESKGKIWCMVNYEGEPVSRAGVPVVPIRVVIERINARFGTKFNLGAIYNGLAHWNISTHSYDSTGDDSIINRGVVPLVDVGLTEEQYEARTARLYNFKAYEYSVKLFGSFTVPLDAWDGMKMQQIITFDIKQPTTNIYFTVGGGGNVDPSVKWLFYKKDSANGKVVTVEKFKLDGHLRVRLVGTNASETKLTIYHRVAERDPDNDIKVNYSMKDVENIAGRFAGYDYGSDGKLCDVYEFDFRKSEGLSPIEIEDDGSASAYPYFFCFNRKVDSFLEGYIDITPMGMMSDDVVNKGYETDIFSNMPDVGCLEFMKSLFYIIGAFPGVNSNGEIVPLKYSMLYQNVYANRAYDWNRKILSAVNENPEKIDYKVSGFGQNNYFLLKNDDLDNPDPEDGEDVYEAGMMCIKCDNNSLERDKTIIQIPWYGPYLKSGKAPNYATERDMKYKEFNPADYTVKKCEAKPALGIIVGGAEGTYNTKYDSNGNLISATYTPNGTYRMCMTVLNPFLELDGNINYDYLQQIMLHPFVVTERFLLDEFDLRELDYTKPVYLEKFNSYFGIVSISRDSKGICKCELIKLP